MPTDHDLLNPSGPGILARVIALSLRNKAVVLIAIVIISALGFRAAVTLPIDAVPDVTDVQVQILTDSPGLSPIEVERFVTFPVESAMSGLPRTEQVRSLSRFGLSVVTVVFEEGTDLWWARQVVSERLGAAREEIPEGYGEPEMGPPSTGLGEIFQFEVRSPQGELTLMDLRALVYHLPVVNPEQDRCGRDDVRCEIPIGVLSPSGAGGARSVPRELWRSRRAV